MRGEICGFLVDRGQDETHKDNARIHLKLSKATGHLWDMRLLWAGGMGNQQD